MVNYAENNKVCVIGAVEDELVFNHEMYGEKFYTFTLKIQRLSEVNDYIKVMVSERLLSDNPIEIGDRVEVDGQFRSYNNYENGSNKLVLTVFAKNICFADPAEHKNPNTVCLNGYVCKSPIYRTTPLGREITDMLIAVNRAYNKSDYIPIIAWGRNARYCRNLEVGDNVKVTGRIQSRTYQKKITEEEAITRVAYEVSVSKLEVVHKDETEEA
jgi:single-stranded DNA-binding protein